MQLDEYLLYWEKAKPLMISKMEKIRDLLQTDSELKFNGPFACESGEEFKIGIGMLDQHENFILTIEFCLLDGGENGGGAGVGILSDITSFNALTLGSFAPFNYTEDAFTTDVDEMADRINMLDEHQAAEFIKTEVMHNVMLQREFVEMYQTEFPKQ